jgi:hypothetical protein
VPRPIPGPLDPAELRRFLDSFLYHEDAFLVDEITGVDTEARRIEAPLDTRRALPYSRGDRRAGSCCASSSGSGRRAS